MTSPLFPPLAQRVKESKVLVVGAGGIGCELLKNLVLTGFLDIQIIDLDTIELSNLNRQFLFQKKHVGRPKSEVAKESAQRFNPDAKLSHHHCSIQNGEFDVNFFKQFTLVMNALDNRAARNHVNRMCLAADVPLIESGSAGYLGQVTVIKKGLTECYECQPKPPQKSFPGCTIRNTPSEPIHCIVWAKHLFNQLFGAADPDEDVSPDREDPELAGAGERDGLVQNGNGVAAVNGSAVEADGSAKAGSATNNAAAEEQGIQHRISTRKWAVEHHYLPQVLFQKLFFDDIEYLLSMKNLWKKRTPPNPLLWDAVPDSVAGSSQTSDAEPANKSQRVWTPLECRDYFKAAVESLKQRLTEGDEETTLVWDKDDEVSMNFVTSCANLRAFIFGISMKSLFDVKAMAGNIIPAIATTNAIIAGAIVMEALMILNGKIEQCKTVYLNKKPAARGHLIRPVVLDKPNPKCYVCSSKPEVYVKLNVNVFSVKSLQEKVLKQLLHMIAPDVEIDGTGTILISSEEGETEELANRTLSNFHLSDSSSLICDDFQQKLNLRLILIQNDEFKQDGDCEIVSDISSLKAEEEKPGPSTAAAAAEDDDLIIEDVPIAAAAASPPFKGKGKRPLSPDEFQTKRPKVIDVE